MREALTVPDILVLMCGLCALLMVGGSLILLYQNKLSFKDIDPKDEITLEVLKKFKLKTRYPALACLALGVVFLMVPVSYLPFRNAKQMMVTGTLDSDADPSSATVTFTGELGGIHPDYIGLIRKSCPSDLEQVIIKLAAPGFEPGEVTRVAYPDQAKNGELSIGNFKLKKKLDKPTKDPDQVAPLPTP